MRLHRFFEDISKTILWRNHLRPTTLALKGTPNLTGVEIGTRVGFNALGMLNHLGIKKLYLVDPYTVYTEKDKQCKSRPLYIAKRNLRKFKNKTKFLVMTSEEAVPHIPDDLDFVYIDGNHDLIKEDIDMYYPKIKKCGMLGGHDFKGNFILIIKTVVEFAEKHNLELHTKKDDWWVIKK